MWEYQAVVDDHHDGDTLTVSADLGFYCFMQLRVRLVGSKEGVQAPELHAKSNDVRAAAQKALNRLRDLAPVNSLVHIRTEKLHGDQSFNRWLAQVTTPSGENVGDVLLAEGLAVPYKRSA